MCSVQNRSDEKRTQDRTPPIKPKVYPVIKSLPGPLCPAGTSSRSLICARADGLVRELPAVLRDDEPTASSPLFIILGPGLPGLLLGQYFCNSFCNSWPVVVQFVRMLSRISVTWRFKSSSFFLSHETLSSWREVPRLNWRAMYFS